MKKILFLILATSLFSSCGVFLQKSGLKNYSPKEKINQNGLNKYQYDFIHLSKLVEEGFPKLDSIFPKEEREIQVNEILSKLETVENNIDFIALARKYLSNLKNQHTNVYLKGEFKYIYPYVVHISSDDWYLSNVSKQFDSLLIGKKIIAINGLTMREIENRLIDYTFAENKVNQQFEIETLQLYNKPQYLRQIGLFKEDFEVLKLKFEDYSEIELTPISTAGKIEFFNISFKENPITKYQNETYLYTISKNESFGYLQFNSCHDKIDIIEGIESYVKPWLRPVARAYVKRQFRKDNPSKQIANFYNPKYPVFKDFVWELIDSFSYRTLF